MALSVRLDVLLVLALACQEATSAGTWSYEDSAGPSHWPAMFSTCGGASQSPINIQQANTKRENWKKLEFRHYDKNPSTMRVKNNGHSAQVEVDAPNAPRIYEGGLKGEFIFAQFHFHWGSDSSMGSEHTVDGVRYPMEMHFVHYNNKYPDIGAAVGNADGIAVLGIFFEITKNDNKMYEPLIKALSGITSASQITTVEPAHPLSAFLPENKQAFYRYQGSLTTPTCNEVVTWTVFEDTVKISERQMMVFRKMLDSHNNALVDNFRPPQPLNGRMVYRSYYGSSADSVQLKQLGLAMYFMSTMAVLMMNM